MRTSPQMSERYLRTANAPVLRPGAAAIQHVVPKARGARASRGIAEDADDTDTTWTTIDGRSLIPYAVAPGSRQLSLYPSRRGRPTNSLAHDLRAELRRLSSC